MLFILLPLVCNSQMYRFRCTFRLWVEVSRIQCIQPPYDMVSNVRMFILSIHFYIYFFFCLVKCLCWQELLHSCCAAEAARSQHGDQSMMMFNASATSEGQNSNKTKTIQAPISEFNAEILNGTYRLWAMGYCKFVYSCIIIIFYVWCVPYAIHGAWNIIQNDTKCKQKKK